MRIFLMALLLIPLAVFAAGGAWSCKSAGGIISVGKMTLASHPLAASPTLSAKAKTTSIAWRIELLTPAPPGLDIKLCNEATCLTLGSLSGQKTIDKSLSPKGTFRFIYSVNSRGQLIPTLHVVSNQLTVNYVQ